MKYFLCFICCLVATFSQAQFCDNFNDDSILNSSWLGDYAFFTIKDKELHSQGPEKSSTIHLSRNSEICDNTTWRIKVRLDFLPSSTNYTRIYLMSSTADLSQPLEGYYIQLGQSGGEMQIRFFKQEVSVSTLLFTGKSVFSSAQGINLNIKVHRSEKGVWSVFSNASNPFVYEDEGTTFRDTCFNATSFFGLYCRYSTASRYNMYAFDDIRIDQSFYDDDELGEPPPLIKPGHILISEIMFDPDKDKPEYIELYNHSEQLIALNQIFISTFDNNKNSYKPVQVSKQSDLLAPGQYLLLSKDINSIRFNYPECSENLYIENSSLPTFTNQSGHIAITDKDTNVIDYLDYDEKMHHPLLVNTKGIALERLDFNKSASLADNWHSASSNHSYGSPGCPNSQAFHSGNDEKPFRIQPEVISPNNDGVDDILQISYHLDNPGFTANIYIFNSDGRLVRHLVNNALLGNEGCFYWDGFNDQKQKLNTGIYIILMDIFNTNGRKVRYKAVCRLIL